MSLNNNPICVDCIQNMKGERTTAKIQADKGNVLGAKR
jgi:hypothetical protein